MKTTATKWKWIVLLLLCSAQAVAQNLVPNYNFDEVTDCPDDRGQIFLATPWYSPNGRTTDLMHRCSTNEISAVPRNRWGNQVPVSGRGMAGIRIYLEPNEVIPSNYREYLAVKLTAPLVAGEFYYLSFQVSPGDNNRYYSDDVGMLLFEGPVPALPIIQEKAIIGNKNNFFNNFDAWYNIEGEYKAEGGEDYLVIGNFLTDDETDLIVASGRENEPPSAYLFVDEVVVENCRSRIPDPLITSTDSIICPDDMATLSLALEGGDKASDVLWSTGDTGFSTDVRMPGEYIVEAVINGCHAIDTITIESYVPVFDLGIDTILCQGETIQLSTGADITTWNTGEVGASIQVSIPGEYIARTEVGGCSFSDTLQIATQPLPDINERDTVLCKGFTYTLDAFIPNATYFWNTGENTAEITVGTSDNYIVNLQTPCYFYSAQFNINFLDCGCEIFAPNAFSPNGDGINDGFEVKLQPGAKILTFEVFDRWGGLVYSSQGETQWQPQQVPDSGQVLFWVLNYECVQEGKLTNKQAKGYFKAVGN